MKLVTFAERRPRGLVLRAGVLAGETVVDIQLAIAARENRRMPPEAPDARPHSDLLAIVREGRSALEAVRRACDEALELGRDSLDEFTISHALDEVQLVAPLPRPNSLRDYMVVREHVLGARGTVPAEWYSIPAHYKGNVDEIYGPEDTIPWPAYTEKLDYELEICAVIGTPGRRIAAAEAVHHILGYTLYNDWSARDIQRREMSIGIGPGISKDFGSSLGPCIVTPDEFDRDAARLQTRVDSEIWSTGTLGTMHFSFEEIIEWTSQEETLRAGDLLGSGTVGNGCGLELNRWLTEGCIVELEAEGIGVLRNRVGARGEGPSRAVDVPEDF
jgi:2-keto-4-pentenoate hydratase/2-oxohepta-3-ene-1,7-dioic acid hydratase in catechol pathway